MITTQDISRIEGATVYDNDGDKVGKVEQIYLDDQTNEPSWVAINTGLFGTSQSFAPLQGASFDGDDLRLGYSKELIKDAPRVEADQHLDRSEEDTLYRHYSLDSGHGTGRTTDTTTGMTTGTTTGTTGVAGTTGTTTSEHATSEHATTDHATTGRGTTGREEEASVVLNEERATAGTESHEAGRARLRKYTTTDTETVSVPVTKEKLVVDRNPVEGTRTAAPIQDTDEVEEITLREERAVVDKETVAVEEVSLAKEAVTEEEKVSAEVRREHADVDVDGRIDDGDDQSRGTGLR